jgi:hypothetical protein
VLANKPEDLGIDRRPDRLRVPLGAGVHLLTVGGNGIGEGARGCELAHVVDRHDHTQVELLGHAGIDEADRARAGHEAADLLERTLRRREADALNRPLGHERLQPLDAQRQMRTTLRPGDRMHLVEDQRPHRLQQLAPLGRQEQVERLGSRDQDVRVLAEHRLPLPLRRVPGAHGDAEIGLQSGERAAKVPFDVVVQGLQR